MESIVCKKLKEVIPQAQFQIPIQAAIGAKVVARETLSAMRKDVTGYLYGGDVSRKKKLLEKQKKGKKRMKQMGKVTLNQESFLAVLKRSWRSSNFKTGADFLLIFLLILLHRFLQFYNVVEEWFKDILKNVRCERLQLIEHDLPSMLPKEFAENEGCEL